MKKYLFIILWTVVAVLLLVHSNSIADVTYLSVTETMKNVFPVLFPYSVIASLMVSVGGAQIIGKLLPLNKIFLMPSWATAPLICGALCGFPLGAKTACDMYETGSISKKEAETIISVANNTGPAFVINVIGGIYFSSVKVGIVIFVSQLISALITSLLLNEKSVETEVLSERNIPLGSAFSEAVKSSFISCLYICGYISVFSSILYGISAFPKGLKGALYPILEFTAGAKFGAEIGDSAGLFLAAFAVGWSGFSVIAQTMSFTYPLGLSVKPLIRFKIIQGTICGIISATYFSSARYSMIISIVLLVFALYVIRLRKFSEFTKLREN